MYQIFHIFFKKTTGIYQNVHAYSIKLNSEYSRTPFPTPVTISMHSFDLKTLFNFAQWSWTVLKGEICRFSWRGLFLIDIEYATRVDVFGICEHLHLQSSPYLQRFIRRWHA